MFIPTNSDGQKLENLRMKEEKKKLKKTSVSLLHPFFFPYDALHLFIFYFLILYVGPTCPFISFLGPFQPRNNLFCPGFNFIYPN